MTILLAIGMPAQAATATSRDTVAVAPSSAQRGDAPSADGAKLATKKWEFSTIGYVFFAGANGETTPRDPFSPVDLHLTPGDVLKSFKFASMGAALAGQFGIALYGDIGVGSKLTWQGLATANYQINHKMTAGLGWRYFKINYHDSDGFRFNVAQSGPIIVLRSVL